MIKGFLLQYKVDIALSLTLATITGIIFYYPNYMIEKNILDDPFVSKYFIYSPISSARVSTIHDELAYIVLTRAVQDGNKELGDVNIYENRMKQSPINNFPFILAGYASRLFGSVSAFYRYADFIFPFFSIITAYFFLRLFLQNRVLAAWGAVLLLSMLSFNQLINVLLFKFNNAFVHLDNFKASFNVFALKYPSFQLVFPYTFLFYIFCYRLLKSNSNVDMIVASLLAGISGYVYIDSLLTFEAQFILLMIVTFFQKRRDLSLKFLITGIMALLLNLPYFKSVLLYMSTPNRIFKLMVVGLTKSVDYDLFRTSVKFVIISLALVYLLWRLKTIGNEVIFVLSIVIPSALIMWASTLFFFVPHTQHLNTFEARNIIIISLLLIIALLLSGSNIQKLVSSRVYEAFKRKLLFRRLMSTAVVLFVVLNSVQIMASEYYYMSRQASLHYSKYTIDRDIKNAYDWLQHNTSEDSVILTLDEGEIYMLPIFTGMYVYLPDAFLTESTTDEVWERVKQGFGFYGIGKDELESIMKGYKPSVPVSVFDSLPKNEADLLVIQRLSFEYKKYWFPDIVFSANFLFDTKSLSFQYYGRYLTDCERKIIMDNEKGRNYYQGVYFIPVNLITEKLLDYRAEQGNVNLLRYKADYVWFGPFEYSLSGKSELNSDRLKLVYQNQKVKLYKIIRN